ncbi:hypothetical protein [Mucilaginibacter sp.]
MNSDTKFYNNLEEMLLAGETMSKFKYIHNVLRKDYVTLLNLTEANMNSIESFNALYRASLRSFFSLLEADIFGLNSLDNYQGYNDKDKLIPKFKKTYKQIAKTWNKQTVQEQYFASKIQKLLDIKIKRDELVHPKEYNHLHEASTQAFEELKAVFRDYDNFINELMSNFFVGTNLNIDWNNI